MDLPQKLVLFTLTGRTMGKSIWTAAAVERLRDDLGPFKLKLDTFDYNGVTYYVVQPVGWMHKDELQWNDMLAWVLDTFGPSGTKENPGVWTPNQRWYCNNARFYFRDIKDRDWFIMRWSA